ncbi:hypothetical protein GCM10009535_10220 [Streptomyces thermocarboxydovorans]|uniref:Uncharacterized protein n=1 Tax=Streptomyces thermocarboxydovorans TaxID=59298 RepID=A0ABP3SEY8_9ACTN
MYRRATTDSSASSRDRAFPDMQEVSPPRHPRDALQRGDNKGGGKGGTAPAPRAKLPAC